MFAVSRRIPSTKPTNWFGCAPSHQNTVAPGAQSDQNTLPPTPSNVIQFHTQQASPRHNLTSYGGRISIRTVHKARIATLGGVPDHSGHLGSRFLHNRHRQVSRRAQTLPGDNGISYHPNCPGCARSRFDYPSHSSPFGQKGGRIPIWTVRKAGISTRSRVPYHFGCLGSGLQRGRHHPVPRRAQTRPGNRGILSHGYCPPRATCRSDFPGHNSPVRGKENIGFRLTCW